MSDISAILHAAIIIFPWIMLWAVICQDFRLPQPMGVFGSLFIGLIGAACRGLL